LSEVLHIEDRSEFQDLLDTETFLVVDFTAPGWCRPCQRFAPIFESTAEYASVHSDWLGLTTFVAVDVDKADWATEEFGIRGVPTVKLFHQGEVLADLKARAVLPLIDEIKSNF